MRGWWIVAAALAAGAALAGDPARDAGPSRGDDGGWRDHRDPRGGHARDDGHDWRDDRDWREGPRRDDGRDRRDDRDWREHWRRRDDGGWRGGRRAAPYCASPRVWIPLTPEPEGPAEWGAEAGATLPSYGWPLGGGVEIAPFGNCPEVRPRGREGDGPRRRR